MKMQAFLKIVLAVCLLSCNLQKKEVCLHDNFLQAFSKADFEAKIPPVYMQYSFFVKLNNDSIIDTNNFYLYEIYKQHYLDKFSSFHMFLCSLYNNEVFLDSDFLNEEMRRNCFMFKKVDIFDNMDLSELKERYLDDSRYLEGNKDLSDEEKFNLLYYFFKNEYYVTESDYTGSFSMWKKENGAAM